MKYYTVYHLHDDTSNCNGYADSCSNYKEYINIAKKQGHKSIAFSNHGGIYDWVKRKQDCDKAGIKYIHGVELYLCTTLDTDERGYHICIYAKNYEGVKELNELYSLSTSKGVLEDKSDRHFYYNPRISINELTMTSDNIIITTACLASILWQKKDKEYIEGFLLPWFKLNSHRVFLEIQYHNNKEQKEYNQLLYDWSKKYNLRLIAGTDTHSSNSYKAECRKILQKSKDSYYGQEDEFDLTWKSYDELVEMFKIQNALHEEVYLEAINNTNVFADMVEDFKLDKSFKYPNLYGKDALRLWKDAINQQFLIKKANGIIKNPDIYIQRIREEFEAMSKQGMESFMLFMAELVEYCNKNNIPYGFCRGSVGGSVIAYITDITDVDPILWKTVFSRFCNADRISLADIDIDFAPEDRIKVYEWIIKKFTPAKTAFIAQFGTLKDRGTIDTLARGLDGYNDLEKVKVIKNSFESIFKDYSKIIQEEVNLEELDDSSIDFDYHDIYVDRIRNNEAIIKINILKDDFKKLKEDNKDIFYYFDGIKGTIISKGNHSAGIIGSPITLTDNIGVFYKDGDINTPVCVCSMKPVDSLNFVKIDILGLKTIGILKDTYKYIFSHYLKSYEIDWNDKKVWNDMITSKVGIFQFEGDYAFDLLKQFRPEKINDMSIVNAALRPSGKSYRDRLIKKEFNKNPSEQIDELLKDNAGFLIFQEDTIKFLTDICRFNGSLADTTRRAIGKKDIKLLNEQLPKILEGYCNNSNKPRNIAEQEAKQFLEIISNSSEYQFGLNHSTGYSMNGFACIRLRTYYPLEFTTAYLNRADNEDDLLDGILLAKHFKIKINPVKFRYSHNNYMFDKSTNSIFKGITSIKGIGEKANIADQLLQFKDKKYCSFIDLLFDIKEQTNIGIANIKILTELDFFSEFGDANLLLKVIDIFDKFYNRKEFHKDKLNEDGLTKDIIEKHASKGIEEKYKKYKEINIKNLILDLINNIQYIKRTPIDILVCEHQYYSYMQSTFNVPKEFVIVIDIDTKYTPKIKTYTLATGEEKTYKVYKSKLYSQQSYDKPNIEQIINIYDVIRVDKFYEKPRQKKVGNDWINIDGEIELVLDNFKMAYKYNN
jgi:DNA polymerase-3 subunit alpha